MNCVSATMPSRLMLFTETVAVHCENHIKHTHALCGQNAEFFNVKSCGMHSHHFTLKGLTDIRVSSSGRCNNVSVKRIDTSTEAGQSGPVH
jgi:hypothetical protein